jgi:dolichol-phosphate mannosyltransferase
MMTSPRQDGPIGGADPGTVVTVRGHIAVVIPCYRVRDQILAVLQGVGPEVAAIYVVDDDCPEGTSGLVREQCHDTRVRVCVHDFNQGVGAAVMTGYRAALNDGATIIVKLDGDGQMDPAEIPKLVAPIVQGHADYVKGNRFFSLAGLGGMPIVRIVGNAALSFITKFSSGYWDVFDPTNGYTAIHGIVARLLPFDRLAPRYFFESDMLCQLGLLRAVVRDVPIAARYGHETSGLSVTNALVRFSAKHSANTVRRIFYNYFLRDFSIASVELALGVPLIAFGAIFGTAQWVEWSSRGVGAYAGTVMLAALPIILGVQLLLAFLSFDAARVPRDPLYPQIERRRETEVAIRPETPGT